MPILVSNNKKQGQKKPQKSASFQFWTESFRPDQKIQTVTFAAVLIFCLERADSNDKILLLCSNVSLDLSQGVINLRGIRDNLPAFGTWQIYSLSPRPEINKNTAVDAVFLFVLLGFRIRTVI